MILNEKIINMVWRAASQHDLDRLLTAVHPTPVVFLDGQKTTLFGFCDIGTGLITIRTHSLHPIPRVLRTHTIIDTAAHELAHLLEYRHGRPHRNLSTALRCWMESNWGFDPNENPVANNFL